MTTLYYLLASNALRSTVTGSNGPPPLVATLRSSFSFDVAMVTAAGVIAPLEAGEGGSPAVAVKAVIKLTPTSSVLLLDTALASNAEEATARRYTAEWTDLECDSEALRAALGSKTAIVAFLEIEVTHAAGVARATMPITLVNANFQPGDVAPDPVANSSWNWAKTTFQAGSNMTRSLNEGAKVMTFNAEDAEANTAAIAAETAARIAGDEALGDADDVIAASVAAEAQAREDADEALQDNIDLKAAVSHAHSAADITSGVFDVARIPYVASGVQVVSSGAIADLDGGQQAEVVKGAVVTTTDGRRWIYSGSGSKTSEASYIESADVTPAWAVIAGKPSEFPPETHTHDDRYYTETEVDSALSGKAATTRKLDDFGTPDDNTNLNATTSRHGLLPKLGGGTTDFLRADGAWAVPAGGGSSLSIRKTSWVETGANGGSDGTGAVGDPAKPYATLQAAYEAGARIFIVGEGIFAGVATTGAIDIQIKGFSRTGTTITLIASTNGGDVSVHDIGHQSCQIITIRSTAPAAFTSGQTGGAAGNIVLHNILGGSVMAVGGSGTDGTEDFEAGGGGGAGGAVTLTNCQITSVTTTGGSGANAVGAETANGGDGGAGGALTTDGACRVAAVALNGGGGGAAANGGSEGQPADAGNLSIAGGSMVVTDTLESSGYLAGSLSSDGCCSIVSADLTTSGGGESTINGARYHITSLTGSPAINAVISHINGVAY